MRVLGPIGGVLGISILAACGGGTGGRTPSSDGGGTGGQATSGSGGTGGQAPASDGGGTDGQAPTPGSDAAAGEVLPLGNCFVGDPSASPQVDLVYRTTAGLLEPLGYLAAVPLTQPPQGGEALFIGVRARNIDGCPLDMSTALLAVDSDVVVALERRPVTLEAAADGWLQPKQPDALSNFSNLPACPKAGLGRRIDEAQYLLQVSVVDPEGRRGSAAQMIVPTCGQPELLATCQCLCSANYVLGSICL